jgi:hypothetical protein
VFQLIGLRPTFKVENRRKIGAKIDAEIGAKKTTIEISARVKCEIQAESDAQLVKIC